jgi:hypothetical protein
MLPLKRERYSLLGNKPASLSIDLANGINIDKAIDSSYTYTRASAALVYCYAEADDSGASQVLTSIPTGIPRFSGARFISSNNTWSKTYANGSPIATSDLKGMLIEPATTNLFLQSEVFNDAAWVNTGSVTVTLNNATAPTGAATASTLSLSTTKYLTQSASPTVTVAIGDTYTISLHVKSSSRILNFAGTLRAGTDTYSYETLPSGYYRQVLTRVFTSAGSTTLTFIIGFTGTTTGDYVVWGAQGELQPYCSSYIVTTTTTLGRAADVLTLNSSNLKQDRGTFVAEVNRLSTTAIGNAKEACILGSYIDATNHFTLFQSGTKLHSRKMITGLAYETDVANTWGSFPTKIATSLGAKGTKLTVNKVGYTPIGTGSNIIVNGGFDTDNTGWSHSNATSTVIDGQLKVTSAANGGYHVFQARTVVIGETYEVSFDFIDKNTSGTMLWVICGPQPINIFVNPPGTIKATFRALATTATVYVAGASNSVAGNYVTIDNVSLRLIGNSAATPTVFGTTFQVGANGNGGGQSGFNIKKLEYYPQESNDSKLILLT